MVKIGGAILLLIMFCILGSARSLKASFFRMFVLTAVVELMIGRGYFIQIGTQQISYRMVCEAALTLLSVAMLVHRRGKLPKRDAQMCGQLLACLLVGWFALLAFPSRAQGATIDVTWDAILTAGAQLQNITFRPAMLLEMLQVLMYLVICLGTLAAFDEADRERIFDRVLLYTRAILCFDLLEIVTKYLFRSDLFTAAVDAVLGVSVSTVTTLSERGGGYILCGMMKEASHYSFVLAVLLMLNLISWKAHRASAAKKELRKDKKAILAILLTMALSMSFSTIYYLACIALFGFGVATVKKGNTMLKTGGLLLAAGVGSAAVLRLLPLLTAHMSLSSFWGRRFLSVAEELEVIANGTWLTAQTALEWSNRVRMGGTYETLKLTLYRPLFGLGCAATSAHSSFAMLLSGCGLLGTGCYIRVIFFTGQPKPCKKNKGLYLSGITSFLLLTLFSSYSLRPYYEIWNIVIASGLNMLARPAQNATAGRADKE